MISNSFSRWPNAFQWRTPHDAGRRSRVRMIPVDRIRVVNPRVRDMAKFERVVESISKLGLKKPITVTVGKPGDDGVESFDLVCGQGRLEAFKALGQTEIPALVRGLSKTDGCSPA
jgi:ParB family chromosome partitioning protein